MPDGDDGNYDNDIGDYDGNCDDINCDKNDDVNCENMTTAVAVILARK